MAFLGSLRVWTVGSSFEGKMRRAFKEFAKALFFGLHRFGRSFGIAVVPVHPYSPVPDLDWMRANLEAWAWPSLLPGIRWNLEKQAIWLKETCLPYQKEYVGSPVYREAVAKGMGPGYGYIEAQVLHGVLRAIKPARIIEVGGGVSTFCMAKACEKNCEETQRPCDILTIEPFPRKALRSFVERGLPDVKTHLVEEMVQKVPLETFQELSANDFLFIDSSHTVKPGGDVNFLVLEVIPRLRPGVFVHFHDIYLPYDYQRNVLRSFLCWTETSLVRALLVENHRIEVLACLSALHYTCKELLREIFPEYRPQPDQNGLSLPGKEQEGHFPSSLFLRVVPLKEEAG
jgi:predicted O-methyltransferase YrrM